jgi:hypothetical protein
MFRDDNGDPTHHPGLTLKLSDFADGEPTESLVPEGPQIHLSTEQLCEYLAMGERREKVTKVASV